MAWISMSGWAAAIVHEVAELTSPTPLVVGGLDLAGSHLEGREERRGAMALGLVAKPVRLRPSGRRSVGGLPRR